MITKEELLTAPVDIANLQALEDDLTARARNLIDLLLKSGKLNIASLEFDCTFDDIAAEAQILKSGHYRIKIGRRFSSAILRFAHWSAPRLADLLPPDCQSSRAQTFSIRILDVVHLSPRASSRNLWAPRFP
ncbi:hypothetical protein [Solimicrobium silvestre]|uniref:Uncharacterized protein n=1 Tax=Solimicrobium silvestre TaxID=2099400 RepID=A0A2S9H1Z4_9BURK|nr:hypothetical protein [Solimicrobium silvestre]PRC93886.1 hypothetical protein S2091_1495 [Solimicrobium silvestre]